MSAPRWFFISAILILLVITGFVREFIFVNLNQQLVYLWYENDVSYMSSKLSFLSSLEYWQVYYLKWFLTLLFSTIFLVESALMLKHLFGSYFWKPLIFLYSLLLSISAVVFGIYTGLGRGDEGYLIARYFMGIAQSPVPLMLLVPAVFLKNRVNRNQ
jgi:hypothetical protein